MNSLAEIAQTSVVVSATHGVTLRRETTADARAIDALVDRAFGPGRFAKTAERLRELNNKLDALCFCAMDESRLAGSVRLWPVLIGDQRVVFLGPIAVDPAYRSQGLGADLVRMACDAARAQGERAILLVGEGSFFQPLGFSPTPPDLVELPGPVDRRRVFWMGLQPDALGGLSGAVTRP